jgi:hypothetical protein
MCLLKSNLTHLGFYFHPNHANTFSLAHPRATALTIEADPPSRSISTTESSSPSCSSSHLHHGFIFIIKVTSSSQFANHKRSCTNPLVSPSILNQIERMSSANSSTRRDGSFDTSLNPYSPRFVELLPNEQFRKF